MFARLRNAALGCSGLSTTRLTILGRGLHPVPTLEARISIAIPNKFFTANSRLRDV